MFSLRRHQINQVDMPITNYGEFGQSEVHSAGCYWPKGSGEPYIFGAGIWIGAIKKGDTLVSCGYNTVGLGCDFCPGPPEHALDHWNDPNSHPEDRVYLSTDSIDLAEWPERDSLGNPIILSDEDGWCEYNDSLLEFHQWEPGTYGLYLHVIQRSFAWNSPINENMIFIRYRFKNLSQDTIRDMYAGLGCDMDVGWADNDWVSCDIRRSLGWTCTLLQEYGWTSPPPYYVGVKIVQGPRADDTVWVSADPYYPGYPWLYFDMIRPGEYLPLTSFTRCARGYDADEEWKRYTMLAGYDIQTGEYDPWQGRIDLVPDDKRMVLGCGPFELEPGEVDTLEIAILFSNGWTGGFSYLLEQADTIGGRKHHEVTIISPNGGESLQGEYEVQWDATSITGNPLWVNILMCMNTSTSNCQVFDTVVVGEENDGSYWWDTQLFPDGNYYLQILSYDSATTGWDISDGPFTVANLSVEESSRRKNWTAWLSPGLPNPFSNRTRISFVIHRTNSVTVKIYDSSGQLVRILVEKKYSPGLYRVVWDGTDDQGRIVPSGVYFCRLTTDDFIASRKLVVLKK